MAPFSAGPFADRAPGRVVLLEDDAGRLILRTADSAVAYVVYHQRHTRRSDVQVRRTPVPGGFVVDARLLLLAKAGHLLAGALVRHWECIDVVEAAPDDWSGSRWVVAVYENDRIVSPTVQDGTVSEPSWAATVYVGSNPCPHA